MMRYFFWRLALLSLILSSLSSFCFAQFGVFDPKKSFACPVGAPECGGLMDIRQPSECEMALLNNGQISYLARLNALKKAKKSIRIQALIFTGDEVGLKIAEILKQKRLEKIPVQVNVDAVSNPSWKTQMMYYDLKQHGIEVEGYEALYLGGINEIDPFDPLAPNRRHHDKMWIIDGDEPGGIAIVGGMNIANEYFRIGTEAKMRWRDQDVALRGEIVKDVVEAFDANYAHFKKIKSTRPGLLNTDTAWQIWRKLIQLSGGPMKLPLIVDPRKTAEVEHLARQSEGLHLDFIPAKSRFIQSRPRFGETFIQQAYVSMINDAKEEILLANAYFVPTAPIVEALKNAARRGVRIIAITNSKKTNDLPQLSIVGRYLYKRILDVNQEIRQENAEIREWQGDHFNGTLHAKYAVFDRKAGIIGSYNLDPRSELHNSETVLAFEQEDMARDLARAFFTKDIKLTEKISYEEAVEFNKPRDFVGQAMLQLSLPLKDLL